MSILTSKRMARAQRPAKPAPEHDQGVLSAIRILVADYLRTVPALAGGPLGAGLQHADDGVDCESAEVRLRSAMQLTSIYTAKGPFLLGGPGLADDACGMHAIAVLAVVAADTERGKRTVLVVADRCRDRRSDDAVAVRQLGYGVGIRGRAMRPSIVLDLTSDRHGGAARSRLRLLDAESAVRHLQETHAHVEALGLDMSGPGLEYLERGLPALPALQSARLAVLAGDAYRSGAVDSYEDVDYSSYAHRNG